MDLKKLIIIELAKKLLTFYETSRVNIVFTRARHSILSRAKIPVQVWGS